MADTAAASAIPVDKSIIEAEAVRAHDASLGRLALYGLPQSRPGGIGDYLGADLSASLEKPEDDCLAARLRTPLTRLGPK